jgi:hypothetical protein
MAYRSFTKTDSSFKSIIPTTVSLELDGIGGLIIGHLFRLPPELLPAGYKGGTVSGQEVGRKLGYIVTRLGHKISNSDWITQLEAQTIILEDSTKTVFNLSEALNAAKQGNAVVVNTSGNVTVNGEVLIKPVPTSPNSEFWTLVAISAAENHLNNRQGMADVAQSIYNRLRAGGYGRTIKEIVTSKGQYEPTFKNTNDWKLIVDKDTAITALKNSKGETQQVATTWIETAEAAIKNPTLKTNAAWLPG